MYVYIYIMLIHVMYIDIVCCFTFTALHLHSFTASLLRPGLGAEPRATTAQLQRTAWDSPCHDDSETTPEMSQTVHVFCCHSTSDYGNKSGSRTELETALAFEKARIVMGRDGS